MQIHVDHDQARRVFDVLVQTHRKHQYPYNIARLPQDSIPKLLRRDPLRHAQFIFFLCHFMRGTLDSAIVTRQLIALWYRYPWMFQPEEVVRHSQEEIGRFLASVVNYHLSEIAAFWLENAHRLLNRYRGDPRAIYKGVKTYKEVLRRVVYKRPLSSKTTRELFMIERGFLGFQGKMTSMLTYFLMDARIIKKIEGVPPAVDFHLLRVMVGNQILVVPIELLAAGVRYDQLYKHGVEAVMRYMRETGVDAVTLGDALWILSTELCASAPGNWSLGRSKGRPQKGVRKAPPRAVVLDPHNYKHVVAYERTCHHCPARHTCTLNSPSGPYYEMGAFRSHPRIELPVRQTLFETAQIALPDHVAPRIDRAGIVQTPPDEIQLVLFGDTIESDT